jgi:iron complex transport system substrate-binding protein
VKSIKDKGIIARAAAILLLSAMVIYFSINFGVSKPDSGGKERYSRIISMAPNITEIIFALNQQDKLVGVTDFCNYPPPAKKIAKVGGYLNPNYEALLALHPDLVILLPEQANIEQYLDELDIPFLRVDNKRVADIISSISAIGEACGARRKAREIVNELHRRIDEVKQRVKGLQRPKVLISIGRTAGSGNLGEIYAAGKNTYFDELINDAGGVNAVNNSLVAYPALSAEGIIRLNPDIIVDFVLDMNGRGLSEKKILEDWEVVKAVNAFRNGKIFVYDKDYMVIPGPRFVQLLEDLSLMLHP